VVCLGGRCIPVLDLGANGPRGFSSFSIELPKPTKNSECNQI
jgi:hypothetical protein